MNIYLGEFTDESVCAFLIALNEVEDGELVNVYLNSIGGLLHTTHILADALKKYDNYRVYVGSARSAAIDFLALLDRKKITASPISEFVQHNLILNGSIPLGRMNEEKEVSEKQQEYRLSLLKNFPKNILARIRKEDVYFSPQEALDWGLIGQIDWSSDTP